MIVRLDIDMNIKGSNDSDRYVHPSVIEVGQWQFFSAIRI